MATITIRWLDDETVTVEVDGTEIATATHDSVGWAGMTLLTETVTELGAALNVPVVTV